MCYQTGSITGSSLMACGEYFDDAVGMLSEMNISRVGVHLTLTGKFAPLTETGVFAEGYKDIFIRTVTGTLNKEHVRDEFRAQIEKVREAGLDVSHLDSHEHVHMFGPITNICLELSEEYKIPYIRFPEEPCSVVCREFFPQDMVRHMALKLFVPGARKKITASGIGHNDVFLGHFHSGRITARVMEFFIDNIREGTTEIAFHPAIESENFVIKFPWYKNAHKELETLVHDKWKDLLREKGIELVPHA